MTCSAVETVRINKDTMYYQLRKETLNTTQKTTLLQYTEHADREIDAKTTLIPKTTELIKTFTSYLTARYSHIIGQ